MYWCLCKWGPWGQHFKFKSDCLFAVSQTKLHVKHQCNLKIKLLDLDLIIAWTKKAIIHLFPFAKGIVFYIYCTVHNFVYTVQLTKTVPAVLSKTYRQIKKKNKKCCLAPYGARLKFIQVLTAHLNWVEARPQQVALLHEKWLSCLELKGFLSNRLTAYISM